MAGRPPRGGGCAFALMLVGAAVVALFLLSFVVHLMVALAAVVVGTVLVLFVLSYLKRWMR